MNFVGRLILSGTIDVVTGLHIGTGGAGGIGLVDNPVIRDPITRQPLVPGSSLKGRLRHALETILGERHLEVVRLFGGAPEEKDGGLTRLYVRDSHLTAGCVRILESLETDSPFVEVKTENRIDRSTGMAEHPRQAERLPAGSELDLELVYNAYSVEQIEEDLENLKASLDFVEDEYIGGSGSRGYGRVKLPMAKLTWKTVEDYKKASDGKTQPVTGKVWLTEAINLCGLKATAG